MMPFFTLVQKEVMRFCKVSMQTIFSPSINAVLYLVVFGLGLGSYVGEQYLVFLIPGLMALSSFNNALQNSASSVMVSKFHGDLADLKLIPIGAFAVMSAFALACLIRGIFVALLVFVVGWLMVYFVQGSFLTLVHPFALLLTLVLGCLSFGLIGIAAGFAAKSFDHINSVTNFVVLPLIYLGGVFYSIDRLPESWQVVAHFNPMVYLIDGVRFGVVGTALFSPGLHVLAGLAFVAISGFAAYGAVRFGSYQRF